MQQPEKSLSERRRYPRIETCIPMNLVADRRNVSAETVNLSMSGICCRVDRPIEMMTCLEIVLMLPDEGAPDDVMYVECEGIVVRDEKTANGHHISIFFNKMERDEMRKLAVYIASHR
ncbi:MAG: PilZ domain-containing protein [Desulfosalsimonadaceae bacterium]|nr:PilZ domain-containing protein [Desulfosalsimonadaceae bacterium]